MVDICLPIIRPTLPSLPDVIGVLQQAWDSGVVTVGALVREFEQEICTRTGARHAIGLSSCTSGLMLAPKALELKPGGEVIVPSFTFAATAQALAWNGLVPVFCESLPGTYTLDPDDAERNLSSKTVAICPVYTFGLPPDVDSLLDLGHRKGLPVFFDSAQGLGATYRGQQAGCFGACEIFSMSPTKVVTAVEGGLVTTNDDTLAEKLRAMRDYGKDPRNPEEMAYLGLSARMSELHAAVALLSTRQMDAMVRARLDRIGLYRERLGCLVGCSMQLFPADRTTSGNYFVLFISDRARMSRDKVYSELKAKGIQTKRYFYPPVHLHAVFRNYPCRVSTRMANTLAAGNEGLALPLYSHMTIAQQERAMAAVEDLLG